MRNLSLPLLISRVVTLLIAFTVHEYAHAFTAVRLGDETPRWQGRLSLNPLRHLDPWGCILLLTMGFGWAKPVQVNTAALTRKNRAGLMLTAAAGPLSNLLMALCAALLLRSGAVHNELPLGLSILPRPYYFLSQFIWTNLSLMVFNLLPISPLDGEKVASYFIKGSFRSTWFSIQAQGEKILMLLFFVLPYLHINIAGSLVSRITAFFYQIFIGG